MPYVEPLSDARTPLADFSRILRVWNGHVSEFIVHLHCDQTRVRQVAEGLSSKRGLVGGWVVTL